MQAPIYELDWDVNKLRGKGDYYAKLDKFDGWEDTITFDSADSYLDLPLEITFDFVFFDQLNKVDYPYNDVQWPIMSKRMLSILEKTGEFAHKVFPIKMVNPDSSDADQQQTADKDSYCAVQLLEYQNYFDPINSKYTRSTGVPEWAEKIENLTVNLPPKVPPIFRLEICPMVLFISEEAKLALEAENIMGVDFVSQEDFVY